jgi:hypothetical protein
VTGWEVVFGFLALLTLGPELHLTEFRRISLPDGAQLSQVVLTPTTEVVVLDNRRHAVWISTGQEWESIGLPFGLVPVGLAVREQQIELVDAAGAVARIPLDRSVTGSWEMESPPTSYVVSEIVTAVAGTLGWIGVGPCLQQDGAYCVFIQAESGEQRVIGEIPTPRSGEAADRVWLSVFEGKGIVAQASQPFSAWEIDLEAGHIGRFAPATRLIWKGLSRNGFWGAIGSPGRLRR